MTRTNTGTHLRKAMGFPSLVLFYITAIVGPRWIARAAAAGPSGLIIWLIAAATLFVPLAFCVLEMTSRYPEEGGLYVWVKRAFGDFAGFITAWTYWAANLVYFPGLLYFAAGNGLFVGGVDLYVRYESNAAYYIAFSIAGLLIAVVMNIMGLGIGKWLSNLGAVGTWVPATILIVIAVAAWQAYGSATTFTPSSLVPRTELADVVFWSSIAFGFGGLESASIMGDEVDDARRTIPRAVVASGILITAIYVLGTLSILVTLPPEEVSGLAGIMQAISKSVERVGAPAILVPICGGLIALSGLGAVGAWLAATARLPFVAGIDNYLPKAFAQLHPRWGSPWVALLVQAGLAAVFTVLGQAGESVHGAYDILVSMGIIVYFIPYLFMFAAWIRVQDEPVDADVIRVPGGRAVAIVLAVLGFLTTLLSIVLSVVPSEDERNKPLAVLKIVGLTVVLVAAGAAIYQAARRRVDAA